MGEGGSNAVRIAFRSSATTGMSLLFVVADDSTRTESVSSPPGEEEGQTGHPRRPSGGQPYWMVWVLGEQGQLGNADTYEELLALQEMLGYVSRGAPREKVDELETYVFGKNEGPDATRCTICLADFLEAEVVKLLPCRHSYHRDCIDPWLVNHCNSCPVCRAPPVARDGAAPAM